MDGQLWTATDSLATSHWTYEPWRRSFVKYGGQGQSGQAIKQFQITAYVNDFRTFNNPSSWQPVGVGTSKKLVLPSIFDKSFITDDVKLAALSNNSFKRMTF